MYPKLLPALLSLTAVSSSPAALIVTGAFDGPLTGGVPKVVELFATTDIADLAQYGVGAANNGGGSDGVELVLNGSAVAGDYLYIVDDGNDSVTLGDSFQSYFGFLPAKIYDGSFGNGGAASINGDDAIEVFNDATGLFAGAEMVVDVFGDINVDGSGQPWEYLDGWAYRKNGTGPDGSTFVLGNFTYSGPNATDGETMNGTAASQFPVGTYSTVPEPGTSVFLVLAGLGLVGRRRR